jgi:stress-induced morphogen
MASEAAADSAPDTSGAVDDGGGGSSITDKLCAQITGVVHCQADDMSDGCGAKYQLLLVAEAFEGVGLVDRHRMVNGVLEEEMKSQIHALQMKTITPKQWEAKGKPTKFY